MDRYLILVQTVRTVSTPSYSSVGDRLWEKKADLPPKSSTELRMYELKRTFAFTSLHYVLLNPLALELDI